MLLHRASRRLRARLDSRLDRSASRAMESLRRGSERANEKRGECFVFFFFFASASTEKTKAPSAVLVACLREYGHLWNPHGVFGKVFGLIRTIFTDRTRGTALQKRTREKRSTEAIDASVRIRLRCRQQPSEKLMFEILVTRVKLRRFEKTKHFLSRRL